MNRKRTAIFVFAALIVFMAALFSGCESPTGSDNPSPSSSAPAAPGKPVVTPADSQLTVQWSAVSGATSYEVWKNTTNNSGTATKYGADATGTSITITGLTNGTTYYVWVKAKNSAGTSGFSPAASGTPVAPNSAPPAPNWLEVTAGDGYLTVEWNAVSGATSYEVWENTSNDSGAAAKYGANVTGTSTTITGLTNGTTYYIWVKAKNSVGTSGFSPVASGTPVAPVYPPSAPNQPRVTPADSQLTVVWDAVSGATSYEVWKNTTNNSGTATKYGVEVTVTNVTITGLTNGTTYYIWVKAKNSAGTSGFSPVASATPAAPVYPPSAPNQPRVTPADSQLTVEWDAVSGAASYEVWKNTINTTSSAAWNGVDVTETCVTITGLTNGTTYYIWVKAKNSAGTSGFSPVASATPAAPDSSPAAPGKPVVTIGDGKLTVEWEPVSEATSYELWTNTTNNSETAAWNGDLTTTKIIIPGLTNNITYYIWVKAKNDLGTSGFSPVASGRPVVHYQLSYDGNGGTLSGGTAAGSIGYGTVVTLPTSGERAGYTLKDFTLSGAMSETEDTGFTFTMPNGDLTVTANWTPNLYQLSYDDNGGTLSGGTPAGSIECDATVILPSSGTKTGYTLSGFTISGALEGIAEPGETFYMPAGSVTVTANWTPNSYQLSYNFNGGIFYDGTPAGSIEYGTTVTLPTSGDKTGYTLKDFTLGGVMSGTEAPGFTFTMPNGDVTVTANWTINIYQLTYIDNGGTLSGGTPAGNIEYDALVTLPSSGTRAEYTLTSFTLSGALEGIADPGGTFYMPAGAVTAAANWHKDSGITITLDGDPKDETIGWDNSPAATIRWLANDSLTASVDTASGKWANDASFEWFIDGALVGGIDKEKTIYAHDYALGSHTLAVNVSKGGVSYSKILWFTIVKGE